jgi:hypothetical protein
MQVKAPEYAASPGQRVIAKVEKAEMEGVAEKGAVHNRGGAL